MSTQYRVLGLELTTFITKVLSHNHWSRALFGSALGDIFVSIFTIYLPSYWYAAIDCDKISICGILFFEPLSTPTSNGGNKAKDCKNDCRTSKKFSH